MDFSIDGSESWNTTSRQDTFINNYFPKSKQSMQCTLNNISKKKKNISLIPDKSSEKLTKKKKNISLIPDKSSEKLTKKKKNISLMPDEFTEKPTKKKKNISLIPDKSSEKPTKKKKLAANNDTNANNLELQVKDTFDVNNGKPESSESNEFASGKSKSKLKKGSNKLEILNTADESDEDALREEIENSSFYKQIQKLMKKAPELNPNYSELESTKTAPVNDSDIEDSDDSSEWSVTTLSTESDDDEHSSMEIEKGPTSEESSSYDPEDSASGESEHNDTENSETDSQTSNIDSKRIVNKFDSQNKILDQDSKNKSLVNNNSENRCNLNRNEKSRVSENLKSKVHQKLAAAKFRYLNEKLYTETGKEAFEYFQKNKDEYNDYHSGYSLQVSKWPVNPVNEIISDIQKLKKTLVIADLGCGDAKIAQTFSNRTVHSFDLVPLNEFVKACDISKVPLPNESVDVVVFCLSLMGVNLKDYLCEAFRILKMGGILKIAEVESRIEDLDHFIKCLNSIGFTLERKNTKHKLFVFLDLRKGKKKCKSAKVPNISLKPCLYKKR